MQRRKELISVFFYDDVPLPSSSSSSSAWSKAISEGGAKGVMCSSNAVNGIPSCASPFLYHILHDVMGFEGYTTSDTNAIHDIYEGHDYTDTPEEAVADALKAGGWMRSWKGRDWSGW